MLQFVLMLQAIIFDFDGTIAHSEPVHYQATKFTVASLGIHFDYKTHLQEYVGYPCKEVLRRLCAKHQIELKPEQLEELLLIKIKSYQELAPTYLQPCEGAVSLIKNLAPHYPLAICTSSQRSAVKISLLHLDAGSLQQYFQNIITIEDVPAGKPDPTGYRMAANSLKHSPTTLSSNRRFSSRHHCGKSSGNERDSSYYKLSTRKTFTSRSLCK